MDSGANSHMCGDSDIFEDFVEGVDKIMIADGKFLNSCGRGNISISLKSGKATIQNTLFVPDLAAN